MSHVNLDADVCLKVCSPLVNLLKQSFGPNALNVMVNTNTGKLLLTTEGATILHTLHLSHPFGRMIVDSILRHYDVTGDGSKTFLFMLIDALKALSSNIDNITFPKSIFAPSHDVHYRRESLSICKAFKSLQTEVFPNIIIPQVLKSSIILPLTDEYWDEIQKTGMVIIQTSLQGKVVKIVNAHLASLLHNLIFGHCKDASVLKCSIQNLLDSFDMVCIKVYMQHFTASRILNGVILQRDFIIKPERKESELIQFILLNCSIELDRDEKLPNSETILIKESGQFCNIANWQVKRVEGVLSAYVSKGINLVISSHVMSELEQGVCRKNGIAAIHAVPEEELQYLSDISGCQIIHDVNDILTDNNIANAKTCKSVMLGGRKCVHLTIVGYQQLVLCAPTEGVCQQYYRAIHSSILCLKMWLYSDDVYNTYKNSTDDDNLSTNKCQYSRTVCQNHDTTLLKRNENSKEITSSCPHKIYTANCASNKLEDWKPQVSSAILGGGYYEMLVNVILEQYSSSCSDTSVKTACDILKSAMLTVPKTLHENSFSSKNVKGSFQTLYMTMCESVKQRQFVHVNPHTGVMNQSSTPSCLEPVYGKIYLIYHLLQLLQQILRIDRIVSVKNLANDNVSTDDD